eukprot:15460324-Alexandrium_andersonii.AAC.1
MRLLEQRSYALESRPAGVGPESSGAASNPACSPAAHAASAASGAGWNRSWSPQDWAAWRDGTWCGSESSGAGASP